MVLVEDDGQGFDAELHESGSKLGLLGMCERVAMVGGSLQVESSPGAGTTIPLAFHARICRRAGKNDENATVLLADDHTVVREGLKALINSQPDMEVIGEACDGLTACELAVETHPDVVVMDVSMPFRSVNRKESATSTNINISNGSANVHSIKFHIRISSKH